MIKKNLIFLVGFMGAGKSTIGPRLARDLKWNFIDLDQEIEKGEGRPIRQIFSEKGESLLPSARDQSTPRLENERTVCCRLGRGGLCSRRPIDSSFMNSDIRCSWIAPWKSSSNAAPKMGPGLYCIRPAVLKLCTRRVYHIIRKVTFEWMFQTRLLNKLQKSFWII